MALGRRITPAPVAVGALVVACFACSPEAASTTDRTATITEAIRGGVTDASHRYSVGVCRGPASNQCAFACSGTLIAPNLVLTVRHCLYETPRFPDCARDSFGGPIGTATDYWVTTSADLSDAGRTLYRGAYTVVPNANGVCGADIALLVLGTSVPEKEASPASPSTVLPISNYIASGSRIAVLGYGETFANAQDFGRRRIIQGIPIQCAAGDVLRPCTGPYVSDDEFLVDHGGCEGDSGAPALEQNAFNQGVPLILGILSRGTSDTDACIHNVYVGLDSWRNFLSAGASLAARFGGYARPSWATDPLPGPLGAKCNASDECQDGTCESLDSGHTFVCTKACDAKLPSSCPDGFTCREFPVTGQSEPEPRCQKAPPPPAPRPPSIPAPPPSSCTAGAGVGVGLAHAARVSHEGLVLLLAAAALVRKRRRRQADRGATRTPNRSTVDAGR